MQFTGHSLPVHQSVSVPWDFNPVPHRQPSSPRPMEYALPSSLEWHVWPGRRSIYNITSSWLPYFTPVLFSFSCIRLLIFSCHLPQVIGRIFFRCFGMFCFVCIVLPFLDIALISYLLVYFFKLYCYFFLPYFFLFAPTCFSIFLFYQFCPFS